MYINMRIGNIPYHSSFAMSSPSANVRDSSPLDDSGDESGISQEPTICDCQNQLAHYDWNGVPLKNLPELCRRTMGLESVEESQKNRR